MGKRKLFGTGGIINPFKTKDSKDRKKKKNPVSSFYPQDYSTTELRSIAKGSAPEAYRHSMKRSDVPKTVKTKASTEINKRKKR